MNFLHTMLTAFNCYETQKRQCQDDYDKSHFELSLKRDNELKAIKEERHRAKAAF
jgi:hypothetical protein